MITVKPNITQKLEVDIVTDDGKDINDYLCDLLNTKNTPQKYTLNIISKIEDRVKTVGFQYSDLRLNLDYSSITDFFPKILAYFSAGNLKRRS